MVFEVRISDEAEDSLKEIHMIHQKEIRKYLHKLKNDSELGKGLTDELSGYRSLCVGDYRIVYVISKDLSVVFVSGIGHRK